MVTKYNHLFHLENTQENRDLVKSFNRNMKEHNSKWRFNIKYRKPKEGQKYGYFGSLKRENAREFAVYLNGGYNNEDIMNSRSRFWESHKQFSLLMRKVNKIRELLENE